MLVVKNISSGYNKMSVFSGVSFSVDDNSIVLLTGGNGCGKSTVLKCIYGLLPKMNEDAQIIFNGTDITHIPASEMIKLGLVYIPQKNNYFESLTVDDNLIVSGSSYSNEVIAKRKNDVYQLPHLQEYRNRTPFNLSGGERQLLALGNALMHDPKLILFDEPLSGLDNENTLVMKNVLQDLLSRGVSFLIVEHKSSMLEKIANNKLSMSLGRIVNVEYLKIDKNE